jgi:hypothetical protein
MRERWNVDETHGEKRVVIELLPDTDEDVERLEGMFARGELAMPRDMKDYLHVKEKPGKWLWLGTEMLVRIGYEDLISTLNAIRPEAAEVAPAIFLLPRFYSEVIGKDGVEEIANQARVLLGDAQLFSLLSEPAGALLTTLATLDMPGIASAEDLSAPGQGDAAGAAE